MKVLVADDHTLVRETIAAFLRSEGVAEVLTVSDLTDAVRVAGQSGGFDLVLLDLNMPGMLGLSGLDKMKQANNGRPVAILSGNITPAIAEEAIKAGASGFLPKTMPSKSIVSAAQHMASGGVYAPLEFLNQTQPVTVKSLTTREIQVLRGMCEGKTDKEIAVELDLQEVMVKLHVKSVCRKFGAQTRTEATKIAQKELLM